MVYITAFFKYLSYVIRHKWYVFIECCKLGIPISGVLHDLSKFRPSEFFPYMIHFQVRKRKTLKHGYSKRDDPNKDEVFDLAWLKHIHRNPHHWQYWILIEDTSPTPKVIPMPERFRKEMLADWKGAGKAQGFGDNTVEWYLKHEKDMILHQETRTWIREKLGLGG